MITKDEILEAHVRFELDRLSGDAFAADLETEIAALFAWLETVKVKEIVRSAQLLGWIRRNIIELPLSDEISGYLRESVATVHDLLREDRTSVETLLPREIYDEAVAAIAGMDGVRRSVTHEVVHSSVYSMLITDVLYHGIKDFVLTENVLAKSIPGAASLVRFGQGALNSAAPGLEKNVDKALVRFISGRIAQTIGESEDFLNTTVDADQIKKISDATWESLAQTAMAELAGAVEGDSLAALTAAVQRFWLHFRETHLFWEIVKRLLRGFFLRYGERTVGSLLAEIGVTEAMVVRETHAFAQPALERVLATGYLEERIRRRLDAFYSDYWDHRMSSEK